MIYLRDFFVGRPVQAGLFGILLGKVRGCSFASAGQVALGRRPELARDTRYELFGFRSVLAGRVK